MSQLKKNAKTRHIPVQIVTLDEDKQHALARGAFSFVPKPTSAEGVRIALSKIKAYVQPRRKRLLVVEDNPAEQLSISALLEHHDIEIVSVDTGAGRLETAARKAGGLRRAGPAAAGHFRLSSCWKRCSGDPALSDMPVIVFTGRELTARGGSRASCGGAQHRGQGRGIARAAAGRDRSVPASQRDRPAARKAAMLER